MTEKQKAAKGTRGFHAYLPSGDKVKANLLRVQATSEQTDNVLWLLNYGRANRIASVNGLAKRTKIADTSTLSRIFAGKYPAGLQGISDSISDLRNEENAKHAENDQPLVKDLRVVQDITDVCELTRVTGTISVLFGPNQSGKSHTLKEIYAAQNNHGLTIYVDMLESGGATKLFMQDLMRACAISERKSYGEMKQRAFRYFRPGMLLICDEFHQTMIGRSLKQATIEAVRAINAVCKCGVVLCGTDVVNDMFEDPKYKKFLGQIGNRGVLRRKIAATPYPEDVAALCSSYGLECFTTRNRDKEVTGYLIPNPEAKKKVDLIAQTSGIGKLCKYMQMAKRLAATNKTPVTWDHFLETDATMKSWEKGEQMKRE